MSKVFLKIFFCLLAFIMPLFFVSVAFAITYNQFAPGASVTISDLVYNDDGTPYTGACTMAVTDPNGNPFSIPGGSTMSVDASTGRHYITFTPTSTSGVWPSIMTCGSSSLDETFMVGYSNASTSDIASAVWGYTGNALGTAGNAISNVWSYSGTTLGTAGNAIAAVWDNILSPHRQLTSRQIGAGGEYIAGVTTSTPVGQVASSQQATDIQTGVTANTTSLTNLDNTNAVWEYLGEVLHSGQSGAWSASLSDTATMTAGQTVKSKVYVTYQYQATDSYTPPVITIHDPNNLTAVTGPMTEVGTGIYETDYNIPGGATPGQWETIVVTTVGPGGQTITDSDYWTLQAPEGPPAVTFNSITNNVVPDITTSVTIENEDTQCGLNDCEYNFYWCVVSNQTDSCLAGGGVNDISYTAGSKRILPGESFTTSLASTVPVAGKYWFKLAVYWDNNQKISGATDYFTAVNPTVSPICGDGVCNGSETCSICPGDCGKCNGGSGGGGGGGANTPPVTPPVTATCNGADFNHDHKVNSTDFSILLAFWKTSPPFRNPCVDINKDGKADSADFSILMYQWGSNGIPWVSKK